MMWREPRSPGADTATAGGVAHSRMRRRPGPPLHFVTRRHVGEDAEHGVADLVSLQHQKLSEQTAPACHMQEVINRRVEIEREINNDEQGKMMKNSRPFILYVQIIEIKWKKSRIRYLEVNNFLSILEKISSEALGKELSYGENISLNRKIRKSERLLDVL